MNGITVYTTTRCPYCVMIKNFLNQQNLPFKEVNVEQNPLMMQELMRITGQMGVPQTEINGKWVIGYDPEQIMKALQN
ncbi:glutaredoxin domain-containing protein [Bacillus sp. S/N-304-OC-R1]|uniref:glutaredoxin family protein n=1 Tax=Bacillus sp. S/N-304-OC-R1 TaxID=2758034 RepID=UPI001C8DE83C|nr:glutaredoxin domain-containing protein [Bacillus sp. S/N-304-OC-R1]MBY0123696.1 glutathione S-transferase N-terminal domain-containing protein [Bacillus sp. S/N-304-OC-R1]